jgi:hypothetical protein
MLGPNTLEAWVSVDSVDRSSEVVIPEGIRNDRFRRNPLLMMGHSRGVAADREYALPIGLVDWLRVADFRSLDTDEVTGRGLFARMTFATDETSRKVCAKYKSGHLSSFSITFIPIAAGPPTREELARRPSWASARTVYREVELLEVSCVTLPDCPDCVVVNKSAKGRQAARDHAALAAARTYIDTPQFQATAAAMSSAMIATGAQAFDEVLSGMC